MGDAYAYNAMLVLRSGIQTLYQTRDPLVDDDLQFTVVSASDTTYHIHNDDFEDRPLTIPKTYLVNPYFDLGHWYLIHRYHTRPIVDDGPDDPSDIDSEYTENPDLDIYTESESEASHHSLEISAHHEAPDTSSNSDSEEDDELSETSPSGDVSVEEINWELGCAGKRIIPWKDIGDLLGNRVSKILNAYDEFPGDPGTIKLEKPRFKVRRALDKKWAVDGLVHQSLTYFDAEDLRNPEFQIGLEYGRRCAQMKGIKVPASWDAQIHESYGEYPRMGTDSGSPRGPSFSK
ncbi:unnamed protein product [Cyclocybe aegerita]|uniref:Uncharacterized protein n=1 Tax=Cyclocybe aegerita TaxID=1973307 RepID=A0A8S0WIN3_CYCAE|nr:unnamed protein product [Cyclocybe aegerita]